MGEGSEHRRSRSLIPISKSPSVVELHIWRCVGPVFLGINVMLVLISAASADRLDWLWFVPVQGHLDLNREGSAANTWCAVVWIAVGVLALAQLRTLPPSRKRLTQIGYVAVAVLAILIASEDGFSLLGKDRAGRWAWLLVSAPAWLPLAVAASWALVIRGSRHPAERLLVLLAVAFGAASVAIDAGRLSIGPDSWHFLVEEGSELMAGAILALVLAHRMTHFAAHR